MNLRKDHYRNCIKLQDTFSSNVEGTLPGERVKPSRIGLGAVRSPIASLRKVSSAETCGRHTAGTFRSRPHWRGLKNRRRSPVRVFATLHISNYCLVLCCLAFAVEAPGRSLPRSIGAEALRS